MSDDMTFDEYSCYASKTDEYAHAMATVSTELLGSNDETGHLKAVNIALLGMISRTGSVAAVAKRLYRLQDNLQLTQDRIRSLCDEELGDLLWYMDLLARNVQQLAPDLRFDLGTTYCMHLSEMAEACFIAEFAGSRQDSIGELSSKAAELLPICSDDSAVWFSTVRVALMNIASDAGRIAQRASKLFARENCEHYTQELSGREARIDEVIEILAPDDLKHDLGSMLWNIDAVARSVGLTLADVAVSNLKRASDHHTAFHDTDVKQYDCGLDSEYQLPRHMCFKFLEVTNHHYFGDTKERPRHQPRRPVVRMRWIDDKGQDRGFVGEPLDDNAAKDDGYRYHDVIHLAHATVLGWSPVLRRILRVKRRETPRTDDEGRQVDDRGYGNEYLDQVEDGARAIFTEDGLAAFVFKALEIPSNSDGTGSNFDLDRLDADLFRHIKHMVQGLEVDNQPVAVWREAYTQAFGVFGQLRANRGGYVYCNLDERTIAYSETYTEQSPQIVSVGR